MKPIVLYITPFLVACSTLSSSKSNPTKVTIEHEDTKSIVTIPKGWKVHYLPQGKIPDGFSIGPKPDWAPKAIVSISFGLRGPMYQPKNLIPADEIVWNDNKLQIFHGSNHQANYYSVNIPANNMSVGLCISKSEIPADIESRIISDFKIAVQQTQISKR